MELAKVYLMALALGFKGRYSGEASGAIELAHYREQVFSFVSRESSVFGDEESDYFCPHAYSHSLEEGLGLKLAYPNRWFIFLIFLISGLTILSHSVWLNVSTEPERMVQEVLNYRK